MEIPPPIIKGDKSYAYATGMIRSLEQKLLTRRDLARLLDAQNEQLWQILEEYGYSAVRDDDWEKSLENEYTDVVKLLSSLSRDKGFTEVFKARYDFKNLALLLKQKHNDSKGDEEYFPGGNLDSSLLKKAVEIEDGNLLPEYMRKPHTRALKAFESTGNPSLIDNILESEYYELLQVSIPENKFVREYYSMKADFGNTSLFMRLKIQEQTLKALWDYFLPRGEFDKGFFKRCAEADVEMLPSIFHNTRYGRLFSDAISEIVHKHSFLQFKKIQDGLLIQKLQLSRFSPFGFEVLFSYIHLKEYEISILRSIIKGKLSNISKDWIKKVLPYGTT
ncbi:V-type ATPase subunit [bacterium]|nr:V-type ATPase subunit [bacterium]